MLYKGYINALLDQLECSDIGCSLGCVFIGSPTCANDVLLLATSHSDLQVMIDCCYAYATRHHYKLHPQKSIVTKQIGQQTKPKEMAVGRRRADSRE